MNIERAERLCDELESGNHSQCQHALWRVGDSEIFPPGQCCVGVAVELARQEGWVNGHWEPDGSLFRYIPGQRSELESFSPKSGYTGTAADEVVAAYGFDSGSGYSVTAEDMAAGTGYTSVIERPSMVDLNDHYNLNFLEIAAVLRRRIAREKQAAS